MEYTPKQFNLPAELPGLSTKQIEVHLGLYKGYVTHVNKLRTQLKELAESGSDFAYAEMETRRRFGFEFNGMRMHEYYFEQLEGGPTSLITSDIAQALKEKYGSWEGFIEHLKAVAMSRGVGWTVLYWDTRGNTPHVAWVTDHELGTLAGLPILYAIDMWEHAFMVDYTPAEKGAYIDAYLQNTNWGVVTERFATLQMAAR